MGSINEAMLWLTVLRTIDKLEHWQRQPPRAAVIGNANRYKGSDDVASIALVQSANLLGNGSDINQQHPYKLWASRIPRYPL